MPHVLQLGDVAGVSSGLAEIIDSQETWTVCHRLLPDFRVSRPHTRALDHLSLAAKRTIEGRKAIRAEYPDLVHLHWARNALLPLNLKSPLVIHAHGSDVRFEDGLQSRLVMRRLATADAVLASTPDLLDYLPEGSIYLPNPVDTEFFANNESDREAGNWVGGRVLIHAQFSHIKGGVVLLNIAKRLKKIRPELKILGISGGEFDSDAKDLGVELLPWMTRRQVRETISSVDVVVGQHLLGILSLSELEAMALARPTVLPVRRDLYGNDPPTVTTSSADETVEQVLFLLDNPEQSHSVGDRSREYVLRYHSYPAVWNHLRNVYHPLIGSKISALNSLRPS